MIDIFALSCPYSDIGLTDLSHRQISEHDKHAPPNDSDKYEDAQCDRHRQSAPPECKCGSRFECGPDPDDKLSANGQPSHNQKQHKEQGAEHEVLVILQVGVVANVQMGHCQQIDDGRQNVESAGGKSGGIGRSVAVFGVVPFQRVNEEYGETEGKDADTAADAK